MPRGRPPFGGCQPPEVPGRVVLAPLSSDAHSRRWRSRTGRGLPRHQDRSGPSEGERSKITEIAASPRTGGLPSMTRRCGSRGRSPDSGLWSGRGRWGSVPRPDRRRWLAGSRQRRRGPWLLLGSLGRAARRSFPPVGTPGRSSSAAGGAYGEGMTVVGDPDGRPPAAPPARSGLRNRVVSQGPRADA